METVNDILAYLNTLAPEYMKMEWDNVGLLFGDRNQPVKKIMVALDPFEGVIKEAAELGCELLVTHHPLIFTPIKNITTDTSIGRSIILLAQNNISAINAHTNLDCAPNGVNDHLAYLLGLDEIETVAPIGTDKEGNPWGLLRQGVIFPTTLSDFMVKVKSVLKCDGLRYVDAGKEVHRVCVGGGACGSGLLDAKNTGCDTFITSDIKYNQFWDAKDMGINLIDAGHFQTENPICEYLTEKIQNRFPDIKVYISNTHCDPMRFF